MEFPGDYTQPFTREFLILLKRRGLFLGEILGRGSNIIAYACGDKVVLVPYTQNYPCKYIPRIMHLQERGKLQTAVRVYDYFYVQEIVNKEILRVAIQEKKLEYPDYVSEEVGVYNIVVTERLSIFDKESIKKAKTDVEYALQQLQKDGWSQCDLHEKNFGTDNEGRVKILDLESFDDRPYDYSYFLDSL